MNNTILANHDTLHDTPVRGCVASTASTPRSAAGIRNEGLSMARILLHAFTPPLLGHRGAEPGTWQSNNHVLVVELTRSIPVLRHPEESDITYLTLGVTQCRSLAPEGSSVRALGLPRAGNQSQRSRHSKEAPSMLVLARPLRLKNSKIEGLGESLETPPQSYKNKKKEIRTSNQKKKSGLAFGIWGSNGEFTRVMLASTRSQCSSLSCAWHESVPQFEDRFDA